MLVLTPAEFQVLADSIKNVTVATAVLIGGIWTLYTFRTLGSRQRSQAEYQKARAEIAKLEADSFRQAVVKIHLSARVEAFQSVRYLVATAVVENVGDRNTKLDFQDWMPFRVGMLPINEHGVGDIQALTPYAEGEAPFGYMTLRTKATSSFPFVVRVQDSGIYHVSFEVPLSDNELAVHAATAEDDVTRRRAGGRPIVWSESVQVFVP